MAELETQLPHVQERSQKVKTKVTRANHLTNQHHQQSQGNENEHTINHFYDREAIYMSLISLQSVNCAKTK